MEPPRRRRSTRRAAFAPSLSQRASVPMAMTCQPFAIMRLSIVGIIREDGGYHAVFFAFRQQQIQRLHHLRATRMSVCPPPESVRARSFGPAQIISRPGRGENLVEIGERGIGLDLSAGDRPGIGGAEIVGHGKPGAEWTEAPPPKRRKFHRMRPVARRRRRC